MSERMTDPRYRSWEALRLMPRVQPSVLEDTNVPGWWLPQTPRQFDAEVTGPTPGVRETTPDAAQANEMQRLWGLMGLDSGGIAGTLANPQQLGRLLSRQSPDAAILRPQAEEGFVELQNASRALDLGGAQTRPLRDPSSYTAPEYQRAWNDVAPVVYQNTNWLPWLRRGGAFGDGPVRQEWLYGLNPESRIPDTWTRAFTENADNPRNLRVPEFTSPVYQPNRGAPNTPTSWLNMDQTGVSQERGLWDIMPDVQLTQAEPTLLNTNVRDRFVGPIYGGSGLASGSYRPSLHPANPALIERNWTLPISVEPNGGTSGWTNIAGENPLPLVANEGWRTLGHEVQHAFQRGRGVGGTTGASPDWMQYSLPENIWREYLTNAPPIFSPVQAEAARIHAYRRVPGEWEARLAEGMWGEMRRNPVDIWQQQVSFPDWRMVWPGQ